MESKHTNKARNTLFFLVLLLLLIDFFFVPSITRKPLPPQPSFDFKKKIPLFYTSNSMLISGTALDFQEDEHKDTNLRTKMESQVITFVLGSNLFFFVSSGSEFESHAARLWLFPRSSSYDLSLSPSLLNLQVRTSTLFQNAPITFLFPLRRVSSVSDSLC
jgi:heme/copper-type cytochrome/quinol oxidase subunit 3